MVTQTVRWLAATLNLLLAGLLLWMSVTDGFHGMTEDAAGWVALASVVTAIIAGTGAGLFLMRRSTANLGLRWHSVVSSCLFTFFIACVAEMIQRDQIGVPQIADLAVLAAVLSVWPLINVRLRHLLWRDKVGTLLAGQTVVRPTVSTVPLAVASVAPQASEHIPLVVSRR